MQAGGRFYWVNTLKELGFEFYKAKKIKTIIIKGTVVNIECIFSKEITLVLYDLCW